MAMAFMLLFACSSKSFAQAFYRHIVNVSGGVGLGGLYNVKESRIDSVGGASNTLSRKVSMNTLALTNGNAWGLNFEYGFREWKKKGGLGLGGYLGTRKFTYRYPDLGATFEEKRLRFYILNLEGRYHFYTKTRFDPYVLAGVGIQLIKFSYIYNSSVRGIYSDYNYSVKSKSLVSYEAAGGLRYFFANNMAAFAELGFGYYYAKLGLTLKVSK